jgi:hypothetical protein
MMNEQPTSVLYPTGITTTGTGFVLRAQGHGASVPLPATDLCPACGGTPARDACGGDIILHRVAHHQQRDGKWEPAGVVLEQRVCADCATAWWTRWTVTKQRPLRGTT